MKKVLFLLVLALTACEPVEYDENGNRVLWEVVVADTMCTTRTYVVVKEPDLSEYRGAWEITPENAAPFYTTSVISWRKL